MARIDVVAETGGFLLPDSSRVFENPATAAAARGQDGGVGFGPMLYLGHCAGGCSSGDSGGGGGDIGSGCSLMNSDEKNKRRKRLQRYYLGWKDSEEQKKKKASKVLP
ncbi:hypothetical protein OROGR_000716 [Orobanche gracilis]